METPAAAAGSKSPFLPGALNKMVFASLSKLSLFGGKSSTWRQNVTVTSASSASSSSQQNQSPVVPDGVSGQNDDASKVVIIGENIPDYKPVPLDESWQKQEQNPAAENPSKNKQKIVFEDEIDMKYRSFKQFDIVRSHSDHHFRNSRVKKPTRNWTKWIQKEWKILEKDLPETIYVRIYEDRMDIARAVIVGAAGTPYHDGLFFFDIFFPPTYPQKPPEVHYQSHGLRINPNLYSSGKVCLSLIDTWVGVGCEKWIPFKSTMLQVLISIQGLVLNARPYFNEPGYERTANTPRGEKQSLKYNDRAFLLSCKTMVYWLRRPPMQFEDFVAGHFRKHGHAILIACRAYMNGAQVGCTISEGLHDPVGGAKSCSSEFMISLTILFDELLKEFNLKGVDCAEFCAQKVKGWSSWSSRH